MTERDYINEMATVLKDYTKSKGIMASHVILEDYAEVLYNQGYRPKEEVQKETARKILKRIADECIIGIDSNLKCMADQKQIVRQVQYVLWHILKPKHSTKKATASRARENGKCSESLTRNVRCAVHIISKRQDSVLTAAQKWMAHQKKEVGRSERIKELE